jgi:predicted dinucleotide-binding enzyme
MKVRIVGSGVVGQTLTPSFVKHGHEVEIGTREPAKLKDRLAKNRGVKVA